MLRLFSRNTTDEHWMHHALRLAARGRGCVEPNPMVGCVIVADGGNGEMVGEGFHERYGENHAEVNALRMAGEKARGARVYVTLEPCCHFGKTPPCCEALIAAGVADVVTAMCDPFPKVAGGGLKRLEEAGIAVDVGLCEEDARALNAPYLKLTEKQRPWVIAKYAMTLDGKIATRDGSSRWISSAASRDRVHELRARVDAILVGVGTVIQDDPMLTVRREIHNGTAKDAKSAKEEYKSNFSRFSRLSRFHKDRVPLRIVADAHLKTPLKSRLVETAHEFPVLLLVGPEVSAKRQAPFLAAGCEILQAKSTDHAAQLEKLLDELGRRRLTNLLAEGGSTLLGTLFDLREIDEVDVYLAPKLVGGRHAPSPVSGAGIAEMSQAVRVIGGEWEVLGGDVHFRGRVAKELIIDNG